MNVLAISQTTEAFNKTKTRKLFSFLFLFKCNKVQCDTSGQTKSDNNKRIITLNR
jgi:hypothetical protein